MKRSLEAFLKQGYSARLALLCGLALGGVSPSIATGLPSDWQYDQPFTVSAASLTKFSLPVETLNAARAELEDLRVCDDGGNEVPYIIERPVPMGKATQGAKSFQVTLTPESTVITLETGLEKEPYDGITLDSPANNFIKAVRIEGSLDGKRWQLIASGAPIFRQPNGASELRLTFPAVVWSWLKLTVDDQRSRPIPFMGARVHGATAESAPLELVPVSIAERNENPGETRLTLNLGAANLDVADVQIETTEPLFMRSVTLAASQVLEDNSIREQSLANGTIYRVAIEGQPASSNLVVPLGTRVHSPELLALIANQDSPPLTITAVRVERRPVYLVFLARQPGRYHLLTGNSHCQAPRYDLAALNMNLKDTAVSPIKIPPVANNPDYQAPEVLSGIQEDGTALDVSAWKFRKPVALGHDGAQQLELDLDVLAHAQPNFQDLRLVREGRQIPFVFQLTSITRALKPAVTATNDARDPKISRWIIRLPCARLPLTRLACVVRTPLFQREMSLYENDTDDHGETYRRELATASWTQTPDRPIKEFVFPLNEIPAADTLFLETHNGDNPPIEIENVQFFHPVTRVLFKARQQGDLFLYYGNPRVAPPQYDLSLVAGQLLAADKTAAESGSEEQLRKSSWAENQTPGKGGLIFWGILGLVVVVLLITIARLLPKSPSV